MTANLNISFEAAAIFYCLSIPAIILRADERMKVICRPKFAIWHALLRLVLSNTNHAAELSFPHQSHPTYGLLRSEESY